MGIIQQQEKLIGISIAITAHNAATDLPDCLASVSFADEIVLLLDRTTDASEIIAQKYGCRVFHGNFPQEAKRRNYLLHQCQCDWILELDADERVTPELAEELQKITRDPAQTAHMIDLDNYIGNRLVRHGWGPTCFGIPGKLSLFPHSKKHYNEEHWDTHVPYQIDCLVGRTLHGRITHLREKNIHEVIQRLNRYTDTRASAWVRHPEDIQPLRSHIRRFFTYFYKSYIGRKGYREGTHGLLIALCAALYYPLAYLKARIMLDEQHTSKEVHENKQCPNRA